MAYIIEDADWANYKDIINGVNADFNQDSIYLLSKTRKMSRYSEDTNQESNYVTTELKCLVQYNVFRTWPMTKETDAGALDGESIAVYFNNNYLSGLGLTSNGVFSFDPGNDLFEFRGQQYRSAGETPVSQAKNEPLHTLIILKRIPTKTTKDKY